MFASFRRRLFRWGIVLFLLACILLFFAPTIVANTGLRNRIIPMATKDLNGSAEIGGMSLGWFSPVELRDVTIKDTSGKTVIVAPKITTSTGLCRRTCSCKKSQQYCSNSCHSEALSLFFTLPFEDPVLRTPMR